MNEKPDVKPGDWVRFYRDGALVLGVVAYVRERDNWPHTLEVCTDRGVVDRDRVYEVRGPK